MMTYFVSMGGLVYLDSIESGKPIAYDDGFTLWVVPEVLLRDWPQPRRPVGALSIDHDRHRSG